MSGLAQEGWFVRDRGKIQGPFSRADLQKRAERSQLARFQEISPDRIAWGKADALFPEWFGGQPVRPKEPDAPKSDPAAPAPVQGGDGGPPNRRVGPVGPAPASGPVFSHVGPRPSASWYYIMRGNRVGPVHSQELFRLIARGDLNGNTSVWRDGMAQWQPARTVPELGLGSSGGGMGKPLILGLIASGLIIILFGGALAVYQIQTHLKPDAKNSNSSSGPTTPKASGRKSETERKPANDSAPAGGGKSQIQSL